MLLTARGAAEVLQSAGLGREDARRVLLSGVAGSGVRTRGALLYDEKRVRALAGWPPMQAEVVDAVCPHGLFVGRIARGRDVDATSTGPELLDSVRGDWRVPVLDRVLIRARTERFGSLPFVATLCGYVVAAAEIVDVHPGEASGVSFGLRAAGPWQERFLRHRLLAGAGRSCFIWGWPPSARG